MYLIQRNSYGVSLVIHRLVQDVTRVRLLPADYLGVFELALMLLIRFLPEREHFSHDTSTWEASDRIVLLALKLYALYQKKEELGIKRWRKISTCTSDSGDWIACIPEAEKDKICAISSGIYSKGTIAQMRVFLLLQCAERTQILWKRKC